MVETLFAEAFADGDVAPIMQTTRNSVLPGARIAAPRMIESLLKSMIGNKTNVHEHLPPRYYLERRSGARSTAPASLKPLCVDFVDLIDELKDLGYFPKVLPKVCVEDYDGAPDVSALASRAIHSDVSWPEDLRHHADRMSDDMVFALIEYFHDQAQRPRTRTYHDFGGCGYHYADCNTESGGVVYRWRNWCESCFLPDVLPSLDQAVTERIGTTLPVGD